VDIEQARALTDQLVGELNRRRPEMDRMNCYYRGDHPLRFASSDFAKYFRDRYKGFADNWTQVVADSPVERLQTTGIHPYGADGPDRDLWRVWQANELDADSQLGYLASVICGRSYVLVWGDPDDEETPIVTWEDPRQAIVLYEAGSRRRRAAALKTWQDGSKQFATLYLPHEVWRFERGPAREVRSQNIVAAEEMVRLWEPRDTGHEPNPLPNPMGVVPMVEIPNRPLLGEDPLSDLVGVIAMQDAVNLLWSQLFTASDLAALPGRVVLGADMPRTPILNDEGEIIGSKPVPLESMTVDRMLWIEGENAKTAHWPAADLSAYTDVLEVAVGHIAAQTRTPQHYLIGKMANLSGDALIAAEAGLVQRCQEKQIWYGSGEREMFALIALAQGNEAKARAVRAGRVLWADVESRSPAQMADALVKLKAVGFPFPYLAGRYGLNPSEVEDLVRLREQELAMDPLMQAMNGRPSLADPAEVPDVDDA